MYACLQVPDGSETSCRYFAVPSQGGYVTSTLKVMCSVHICKDTLAKSQQGESDGQDSLKSDDQ